MLRAAAFIEPCLPSPADKPPSGSNWIHEIKHDGYRLMARRDPVGIRLITRNGNDWSTRSPLVVEAVNHLKVRSCLIDGEVVCCDEQGSGYLPSAPSPAERAAGLPLRLRPAGAGRHGHAARAHRGAQGDAGQHPTQGQAWGASERAPGAQRRRVFQHACKMGLEGIVSKRLGSRYRSGRSPDWLKFKNPEAPAVKREAEEDWSSMTLGVALQHQIHCFRCCRDPGQGR